MDQEEKNWRGLEKDIDLYKFYLELLIKAATFFFAITGAIVAWFFSHTNNPLSKFVLFLPLIICIGFLITCVASIKKVRFMIDDFIKKCERFGMNGYYDMSSLIYVLYIFSCSYAVIIIGLLFLLFSIQ